MDGKDGMCFWVIFVRNWVIVEGMGVLVVQPVESMNQMLR